MTLANTQRENVEAWLFHGLPAAVLTAFAVAEGLHPGLSSRFAAGPLLLSLLLVGMPHGAADFAVNKQLTGSTSFRLATRSFTGYFLLLLLSLLLYLFMPGLALAVFLLTSALHFGLADARDLTRWQRTDSPNWLIKLSAAARGLLLLALPFFTWPLESFGFFNSVAALAGGQLSELEPSVIRTASGVVIAAVASMHLFVTVARWKRKDVKAAMAELLETAVLIITFVMLHPVFAIGLYLVAWHSWRHLAKLTNFLAVERPSGVASSLAAVARVHVQSLPLLVPTLAIFAAIAWLRIEVWSADALTALTVAVFVVVTLPHHLLVERLVRQVGAHRMSDTRCEVEGHRCEQSQGERLSFSSVATHDSPSSVTT